MSCYAYIRFPLTNCGFSYRWSGDCRNVLFAGPSWSIWFFGQRFVYVMYLDFILLIPSLGYTFSSAADSSLGNFNINAAPSYLFSTIIDIQAINPYLKVHVLPWSPVCSLIMGMRPHNNSVIASLDERFRVFERRKSAQHLRNHMFVRGTPFLKITLLTQWPSCQLSPQSVTRIQKQRNYRLCHQYPERTWE